MKKICLWGLVVLLCSLAGATLAHENHPKEQASSPANIYGDKLGTVILPFSCNETASKKAERGLALLHHMTYVGARAVFNEVVETDPDCAIGYWGQSMSYIHPLWSDPPDEAEFARGKELASKAAKRASNELERAYTATLESYYAHGRNISEKHNLSAYADAWRKVYEQFPKDIEAASFYALANLATVDPSDKSYSKQKQSAKITKQILESVPDHPGAHHYTIHALDYPTLAIEALDVARNYGKIAPAVPHALHMPAHIFTRLGLWEESIDMNRRSANAALKHPADGKISLHYLHALDYLVYAYLQRGEDAKAEEILNELMAVQGPYQTHVAAAYSFAAVPARMALERQQWATAATLEAQIPSNYPWQVNPAMEAITYFSNGLGAARSGDTVKAREAIEHLKRLQKQVVKSSDYWAKQVKIQRLSVEAWLNYAEGEKNVALKTMREATALEATTEKHPVTPGEVLPAHELLADMLFELNRYQEAQHYYEATLERSPNRFNSLYGAGQTAELAGDKKTAARHYGMLNEVAATDSTLKRLEKARAFCEGSNTLRQICSAH
jgi:tetratricopeptide (TPR) repeat protein